MIEVGYLNTPVGVLKIRAEKARVIEISFTTQDKGKSVIPMKMGIQKNITKTKRRDVALQRLYRNVFNQLTKYFAGRLRTFDLPINPIGTPFQKNVWRALRRVPYGKTTSYADIAKMIGRPTATRAVANAIASNHIAIIIPCHRVVRSDGKIGGYAWGTGRKKKLLGLEKGK